jgi:hypothetical protein
MCFDASNDKCMCQRDNSLPGCGITVMWWCGLLLLLVLGCVSWATGKGQNTWPSHKGTAAPDCTPGTCNPVNFTVLKPSNWKQGHIISVRIDEKGLDPRILMHLKLVTDTHERSSYQVFHFFYEEMRSEFSISTKARNLFLSLAESIAQTLSVTCLASVRP